MISRWVRTWYGAVLDPCVRVLAKVGIGPDGLTVAGLVFEVLAGILFAFNQTAWGAAALVLGQLLDSLDGQLARTATGPSILGGFLDSIFDHLGDFAVYMGLLWHYLAIGARTEVILIVVALFGSVFGSHVRSRAGMVGIDTRTVGLFTRFERTVVLLGGLLLNRLTMALWVLAVFNNLSALQRIIQAVRAARYGPGQARS